MASDNRNQSEYIISLLRENDRLLKENSFLKNYLVTVKNNATLKTANVLNAVLTWTDDSLCRKFEGKYICIFIPFNLYTSTFQTDNNN